LMEISQIASPFFLGAIELMQAPADQV